MCIEENGEVVVSPVACTAQYIFLALNNSITTTFEGEQFTLKLLGGTEDDIGVNRTVALEVNGETEYISEDEAACVGGVVVNVFNIQISYKPFYASTSAYLLELC